MNEKTKSRCPTIFITGGGRRLGLYLVEHYLKLGYRVISHYHSKNELEAQKLARYSDLGLYYCFQANLAQIKDVERMLEGIEGLLGKLNVTLDGLIHNASCFYPDDDSVTAGQLWQSAQNMMAVHVTSPQLITLTLASYMSENSSIIAMSDIYADLPNERFSSYCSAKAGLQNLALSLAQRLAPSIRVNVIQPGPVKFLPEHTIEYRQKVLSQSLLKEELGYQSIQQGIGYLLTAQGVTGTVLRIDGGRSCANRYEQQFSQ